MTLEEALSLKTGDTIEAQACPRTGRPTRRYVLSAALPARPELGYAPTILGWLNGERRSANSLCIILDGGPECTKALGYWTKVSG